MHDGQKWLAPLNPESIADTIKWSFGEESEEKQRSRLACVLTELFHHGPEEYAKGRQFCLNESRRLSLGVGFPTFKDFTRSKHPYYFEGKKLPIGEWLDY